MIHSSQAETSTNHHQPLALRTGDWLHVGQRLIRALARDISAGGLDLQATSMVYTTLLSLAPLLAVSFSVLTAFGVHNQMRPLLLEAVRPLGGQGMELVDRLIGFVNNLNLGVLGFAGFALLFYTVLSLLQKIEQSFNRIWQVEQMRSFGRRFSDYLSVLLVGPVLVFSAIGLIASMANHRIVQGLMSMEPFGTLFYILGLIVPNLMIIAALTFLYSFIPNTKVSLKAALVGGIFAGLGWRLLGWLFGTFVAGSAQYAAVYSSFAILILFMIWLYWTWLILLAGVQLAFYVDHPRQLDYPADQPLGIRLAVAAGLSLMIFLAERFHRGEAPPNLAQLVERLNLPASAVKRILRVLAAKRLIISTEADPPAYLPGRDLAAIPVNQIMAVLERGDHPPGAMQIATVGAAEPLLRRLEDCRTANLGNLNLADLLKGEETTGARSI